MSKTTLKMIMALGIIGAITSDAMLSKTGNINFDGLKATIKADINTNVIFDGEYTNTNNTSDNCITLESAASSNNQPGAHIILSGEPTIMQVGFNFSIDVTNQNNTIKDIFNRNTKVKISNKDNNSTLECDIPETVKNNTALNTLSGGTITPSDSCTITEEFTNTPLSRPLPSVSATDAIYVEFVRSIMFGCSLTAIETSMAIRESLVSEASVSQPYLWITDDRLRDALTDNNKQKILIAFMAERSTNTFARACMNYNLADNCGHYFDTYTFGEAILPVMTADGLYKNPPENSNLCHYVGNVSCPGDNTSNSCDITIARANSDYVFKDQSFWRIHSNEFRSLNRINCCMQTCVYSIETNLTGASYGKDAISPDNIAFRNSGYYEPRSLQYNLQNISTKNNIGIAKEQTNINDIIKNFDVRNYCDTYNDTSHTCMFQNKSQQYFNNNFHNTQSGYMKYIFGNKSGVVDVYAINDAMEILSLESTIDTVCNLDIDKIQGSNDVLMQLLYKPLGGTFADINNSINNSPNKKLGNFKKQDAYWCLKACEDKYNQQITFGTNNQYLLFKNWNSMKLKIEKLIEKIFNVHIYNLYVFDNASSGIQAELATTPKEFLFSQALYYYIHSTAYSIHNDIRHIMAKTHCLAASKACFLAMLGADVTKVNEIIDIAHNNIWKCTNDAGEFIAGEFIYEAWTSIDTQIIFTKLIELSNTVSPTLSDCFKAHSTYYDTYEFILTNTSTINDYDALKSQICGGENSTSTHIRNFMDSASKNAPYLCDEMDFSRRLLTYLSCAANSVKCYIDHDDYSSPCCRMQRDTYNLYKTRDSYLAYDNRNNSIKEILGYDTLSHLLTKSGKLNDLMNALTSDPVMYNEKLKYGFRNYIGLVDSILTEQCVYNIRADLQNDSYNILSDVTSSNISTNGSGINKVINTVTNMVFDAYQIAPYNTNINSIIWNSNYSSGYPLPGIFNNSSSTDLDWKNTPTRFSKDGKDNIDPSVKDFVIALRGLGNVESKEKIAFGGSSTVKFSTSEMENFLTKYKNMLNVLKDKPYAFPTQSAYRQYINASIASYNTLVQNKSQLGINSDCQEISFMPEQSNLVINKGGKARTMAATSEVSIQLLNHFRFGPRYDLSKTYSGIPLNQVFSDASKSITLKKDAPGFLSIGGQSQLSLNAKILQELGYTTTLPMMIQVSNDATLEMLTHQVNSNESLAKMELFLNKNTKVNVTGNGNYENKTLSYNKSANDETSNNKVIIKPKVEIAPDVTMNNVTIHQGVNIGMQGPVTIQTATFK